MWRQVLERQTKNMIVPLVAVMSGLSDLKTHGSAGASVLGVNVPSAGVVPSQTDQNGVASLL